MSIRRTLLALALLAPLCAAPAASRAAGAPNGAKAYVTSESGGKVTVVDLATRAAIGAAITVGAGPRGVAASPDESVVYVANSGSANVSVISTSSDTVIATIPLTAGTPNDVVFSLDGLKAYVSLGSARRISVISTATRTETTTILVPQTGPSSDVTGLALSPDGSKLYVVNYDDATVAVIATATDTVVGAPITVGAFPRAAVVTQSGDKVFVVGEFGHSVIATATNTLMTTSLEFRGPESDVVLVGDLAYVTNSITGGGAKKPIFGDAALDVYDLSTNTYVDSMSFGQGEFGPLEVRGIAKTPDGACAYVVCAGGKAASIQPVDLVGLAESGGDIATQFDPRDVVVVHASGTETVQPSYFLPKSVKLSVKGAGKDALTASGVFDEGDGTAAFAQGVTVQVDRLQVAGTPVLGKGGSFVLKSATTTLTVKPRLKGSSRGTWTLSVKKSTLSDRVAVDGFVDLSFAAAGMQTATARVKLERGGFALGKKRGSLASPAFFPTSAKISLKDGKPDTVSLKAGFAANDVTPTNLASVRVSVGPTFVLAVPGASFVKTRDVFKYAPTLTGRKVSIVLDFAKGTVSVTASGFEAGALAAPLTDVVFDLGLGGNATRAHLRLSASGAKRTY